MAILAVLTVAVWSVYDKIFVELYWREIAGPPVEKDLGFRLEYVATEIPGREHMYVITHVTPGGRFDRAGIEPGDTKPRWIGYAPRLDLFYTQLADPTQYPLKLQVVNVRHAGFWPRHVREVTIPSARATPNSALQPTSARHGLLLRHVPRVGRSG